MHASWNKHHALKFNHEALQAERKAYEVVVQDGKLIFNHSGEFLHTAGGPENVKWIFVLSTFKTLYVGLKNKGTFQHSSFMAGGAILCAGRLEVEDGIVKVCIKEKIWGVLELHGLIN